jgi:NADPH-dependent 2,4-dienoyl-CoA reductase/sulfur reductase-like enzyme
VSRAVLERVAVVGGGVAALRTVQTLRRRGFEGKLTIVGGEPHPPYNRPPLSKDVLAGKAEPESTQLATPDELAGLDIELRLGEHASRLDLRDRRLVVGEERIPFDGLVIATGASPRRLPALEEIEGVHLLRTLDDALALRGAFERGPRVLVVGAGFIGSEVAATARSRSLDVTVVELSPTPLAYAVGPEMGAVLASIHAEHGTTLRAGTTVSALEGDARVERARLTDGSVVDADVVVVGVGVTPNTDWLQGSGLDLADGVLCSATLEAGVPFVYAAGDVARWPNDLFGSAARVEHWTTAGDHGTHVAKNLLAEGDPQPFVDAGYVWSDQYGLKIQVVGLTNDYDEVAIVDGDVDARKFVALYRRGDRVVGALGVSSPPLVMRARRLIEQRTAWAEALGAVAP